LDDLIKVHVTIFGNMNNEYSYSFQITQPSQRSQLNFIMAIGVDHSFNQKWPSYWGDKTSTLDWCEENYLYSQYVAEFCKK
jgi:hypothetical protein